MNQNFIQIDGIQYPILFLDGAETATADHNGERINLPVFKLPGLQWTAAAIDIRQPQQPYRRPEGMTLAMPFTNKENHNLVAPDARTDVKIPFMINGEINRNIWTHLWQIATLLRNYSFDVIDVVPLVEPLTTDIIIAEGWKPSGVAEGTSRYFEKGNVGINFNIQHLVIYYFVRDPINSKLGNTEFENMHGTIPCPTLGNFRNLQRMLNLL